MKQQIYASNLVFSKEPWPSEVLLVTKIFIPDCKISLASFARYFDL